MSGESAIIGAAGPAGSPNAAATFIAVALEQARELWADPMQGPSVACEYLERVLEALQKDFGFGDPREA